MHNYTFSPRHQSQKYNQKPTRFPESTEIPIVQHTGKRVFFSLFLHISMRKHSCVFYIFDFNRCTAIDAPEYHFCHFHLLNSKYAFLSNR